MSRLEAWATRIATSVVSGLPAGCARVEVIERPAGKDADTAVRITPEQGNAATITLFVYEDTRSLELFAGAGLSFAFEELGDDPSSDLDVDAEVRMLCTGIVAGRVRERVVRSGDRVSTIEGVVETPGGARRSTHVFGRAARDAREQTYDYAPYCRSA